MKRAFVIIAALLATMLVVSCGTSGGGGGGSSSSGTPNRIVDPGIPQVITDELMKNYEDGLVGVGTAKMGTLSLSRTAASTRARADISRQMNTMIRDMVRDYTASTEMDPSATVSFTENITTALSESKLTGAVPVAETRDADGNYWVAIRLSKANTVTEINQAQAAAKLAIPAMLSFDAESRMDDAFAKAAAEPVTYNNKD